MRAKLAHERVGDVLKLERRLIEIDAATTYELIGVYSFGNGIFHREPTIGADLGDYRFSLVREGDLVLSNIQAWEGAIALAGKQDDGCIGTHRFLTYVPVDNRVDTNYLRYFLLSERGIELIRKASPGSIVRNRTLGIKAFESLEIPLPPIKVQRRIGHTLSVVRKAAHRVQHLQSRADLLTSALPSSIAQRPDLSHRDKEALGWRRLPLRDVMSLALDTHVVQPGRAYANVGILNYGRGVFEKPPIDGARSSARTLNKIHAGQFIYSRLFAFEGAYAAVPPLYDSYYVSSEFPTFDLDPHLDAEFLAAYFRSPAVWDELRRSARGLGVRRQRIHADTLLAFEIWLPPASAQKLVITRLHRLHEYRVARDRVAKLVAALTSAALNSAFTNFTT